jgi:hypothetical protein
MALLGVTLSRTAAPGMDRSPTETAALQPNLTHVFFSSKGCHCSLWFGRAAAESAPNGVQKRTWVSQ